MKSFKRLLFVGTIGSLMLVVVFTLINSANAVGASVSDAGASAPNSHVPGTFLTGPNEGSPLDIAQNYIRQNRTSMGLTAADVTDMIVTDQYMSRHNGVTHIYLQQRLNGIGVHNAVINIGIADDGSIINLGNHFVADLASSVVADEVNISAVDAVVAAAGELGLNVDAPPQVIERVGGVTDRIILDGAGLSQNAIPVHLIYQPADDGVYLAWDMTIIELSGKHAWSIRADAADGRILSQIDWVVNEDAGNDGDFTVAYDLTGQSTNSVTGADSLSIPDAVSSSYRVFPYPLENPDDGPDSLEDDPNDPLSNPFGWHDVDGAAGAEYTITRGNNVYADSDLDANNAPDGNAPDGGAGLIFDYPINLSLDPSLYLTGSIVNLFYWNNLMHDIGYRYGFDEAAGNFQENNYGNGGAGSDYVDAQALDGSGVNNANFLTLPDGQNPRMQMFRATYPFGQAVTVTAPLTMTGVYTANPSNNGGTANGLAADIELVSDGVAPTNDGCKTIVNDLTGKIALILWSEGLCNSSVFVLNAANAGAIAAIIIDNTPLPLTNFGGSPLIPSVAIGSTDGQLFLGAAAGGNMISGSIDDNPTVGVDRDTDLDNGIIAHEYGHGISNRLTGGPSNVSCLGNVEQMGEGWSDLMTLFIHSDPGDLGTDAREVGVWSLGAGFQGIRIFPYSTDTNINPQTYDSIKTNGTSPHSLGEVWALMVWEVYWNLVDKYGFNPNIYDEWTTGGNNLAFQLVMDGMKLQPCSPGFVTGRDAILLADQALTSGANQCEIWAGFAKRGLGYSASQGSPNSRTDGIEAFDMPSTCSADLSISGSADPDPVTMGQPLTYTFVVNNNGVLSTTNVVLTDVLDVDTDFASVATTHGSCVELAGVVTCGLGTMFPDDVITVTVVTTATQSGTVTNVATVAGDVIEDTSNNTVTVDTTVNLDMQYIYIPVVLREEQQPVSELIR